MWKETGAGPNQRARVLNGTWHQEKHVTNSSHHPSLARLSHVDPTPAKYRVCIEA